MSNENKKKKSILKSKFFLTLYGIPCWFWILLSLIAMTDKSTQASLTWIGFFIENIIVFIIWFLISFFIAFLHSKKQTKDIKMGRTPERKWQETTTFKKIRFPFIMSIITFFIGIFLSYDLVGFPLKVQLTIFLVAYIPFILYLVFILIIYKNKQNKKVVSFSKIISIVIVFFLIYYYFIAAFVVIFAEATNPITNPKYYSYHIFVAPGLKKVFPSKIPKNVENVKFLYAPGMLQGGTRYTLYYVDKNMTLDKFDKKYKEQAKWIGYKNDYTENDDLLSSIFYYTPSEYKNEDDYIVYLIRGNCYKPDSCNHGEILIAAFNEKTQEVVFSSEDW